MRCGTASKWILFFNRGIPRGRAKHDPVTFDIVGLRHAAPSHGRKRPTMRSAPAPDWSLLTVYRLINTLSRCSGACRCKYCTSTYPEA
jgi:hypothetical protein